MCTVWWLSKCVTDIFVRYLALLSSLDAQKAFLGLYAVLCVVFGSFFGLTWIDRFITDSLRKCTRFGCTRRRVKQELNWNIFGCEKLMWARSNSVYNFAFLNSYVLRAQRCYIMFWGLAYPLVRIYKEAKPKSSVPFFSSSFFFAWRPMIMQENYA